MGCTPNIRSVCHSTLFPVLSYILPQSGRIVPAFTYRSLFPIFRILTISSRNTAIYILFVLLYLMSSRTSCGFFRPVFLVLTFSDIFQPPSLFTTGFYVPFHPWRCCLGCRACLTSGLRMRSYRRLTLLLHFRCSRPCSALPSFFPVPA